MMFRCANRAIFWLGCQCWQSENFRPTWRCHHVTIHDAQQRLSAHVVAITSWSICLEQERRRERARAILHVHCANVRRVEADARVGQAAPGSSRPAMCSVALSSTKPFKAGQVRFRVAACPLGSMSGILPTIARMQRSVIAATQDMMHLRRGQIWP